jgi:hypothetical protein
MQARWLGLIGPCFVFGRSMARLDLYHIRPIQYKQRRVSSSSGNRGSSDRAPPRRSTVPEAVFWVPVQSCNPAPKRWASASAPRAPTARPRRRPRLPRRLCPAPRTTTLCETGCSAGAVATRRTCGGFGRRHATALRGCCARTRRATWPHGPGRAAGSAPCQSCRLAATRYSSSRHLVRPIQEAAGLFVDRCCCRLVRRPSRP